ncbi:hypothetical protein Fcan01_01352 [Folsomia candida]|uniref:Uncharacterized protein n=1 Tax=Folsomia candida TaxID=158441 RepID=A0A226EY00_FOLCA|nr:hypothetical protein Fcan01_01352 [Folsomia candida]
MGGKIDPNSSRFNTEKAFIHKLKSYDKSFCWTFLVFDPEQHNYFVEIDKILQLNGTETGYAGSLLQFFLVSPPFLYYQSYYYRPQYVVWVTDKVKIVSNILLHLFHYGTRLWSIQHSFVVQSSQNGNDMTNFLYLNRYSRLNFFHSIQPDFLENWTMSWITINCLKSQETQCFERLVHNTKIYSKLNMYFWRYGPFTVSKGSDSAVPDFRGNHSKLFANSYPADFHNLAKDVNQFDEFIGYVLFEKSLYGFNTSVEIDQKKERFYVFNKIQPLSFSTYIGDVIIVKKISKSFLSCYGSATVTFLEQYATPLDYISWISCLTVFGMITTILWVFHPGYERIHEKYFIVITLLAPLLDTYVPDYKFSSKTDPQKCVHDDRGRITYSVLKCLALAWLLFTIVLTTGYKSAFTSSILVPLKSSASWKQIYDVNWSKIYSLIAESVETLTAYNNGSGLGLFYYYFLLERTQGYAGQLKKLSQFQKLVETLWQDLIVIMGMDKPNEHNEDPIFKPLSYRFPAHLLGNLSVCNEKVAYLDDSDNIREILKFMNNNNGNREYFKGGDDFLDEDFGFETAEFFDQSNFVVKQMKILLSSGIYRYWENWYERNKPNKLFSSYYNLSTNSSAPKSTNGSKRLPLSGKITTIFYTCMIFVVIAISAFLIELIL